MKRIAIIGGGAAGLAAAVSAAQKSAVARKTMASRSFEITVFEAADRIGKSILASGNGRCNFSNSGVSAENFYNEDFVGESMKALPPAEVLSFFHNLGLLWHEESGGRLYPLTNKASSVLDALRFAARDAGVECKCNQQVIAVTPVKEQFLLSFDDDRTAFFDTVIVACGGKIARSLLPAHYRFCNTEPMLGPLRTDTRLIKGLNNIRVRCAVSCDDFSEQGEVQFRDYGISGIVSFNLSRFVHPGSKASLDFLPLFSFEETRDYLEERFVHVRGRSATEFCAGMLQRPLAQAVLKMAHIDSEKDLQREDIPALTSALKKFVLEVQGIENYRQCQVRRGGFDVEIFDPLTLESRIDPGLFLVGEALDIDGPCGGYNLHWAWTSGILAGRKAAL